MYHNDEQSIAFSDGEDVHFVSASKFTGTPGRVCRGSRRGGVGVGIGGDGALVTALAFDAVSTAVLYVGFDNGDVMVRPLHGPTCFLEVFFGSCLIV